MILLTAQAPAAAAQMSPEAVNRDTSGMSGTG
jgi:hypothetical protein